MCPIFTNIQTYSQWSFVTPKKLQRFYMNYYELLRNFWHLSAKILYTVEQKTATSPCVHFEVAASPSLFPFRWHLVYRVMEVDHNIQRWTIWNFDNDRMKKFHKNLVVFGTLLLLLSDNFVATRRTSKG